MTSTAKHSFINTGPSVTKHLLGSSQISHLAHSTQAAQDWKRPNSSIREDAAPPLPPREFLKSSDTRDKNMISKRVSEVNTSSLTQGCVSGVSGSYSKEEINNQHKHGVRSPECDQRVKCDNKNLSSESYQFSGKKPVSILKNKSKYENNTQTSTSSSASSSSSLVINSLLAKASTGLRYNPASRRNSDKVKDGVNSSSVDVPPKLTPRIPTNYNIEDNKTTRVANDNESDSRTMKKTYERNVNTSLTPEPSPLTRTNVTEHDKIWTSDDGSDFLIGKPLNSITPETTAEFFSKLDPLDITESASDSSADTMIMMTTEEEQRNERRIQQSTQEYESRQQGSFPCLNDKLPYMDKASVDGNNQYQGKDLDQGFHEEGKFQTKQREIFKQDTPRNFQSLRAVIESMNETDKNFSIVTSKRVDVMEEHVTDDGYGTNSSTGTNMSSPLSSSSSSSTTNSELENSQTQCHGILKNVSNSRQLPPKPILKNPLPEQPANCSNTWAARRKTRVTEATDNSLQEKLRQLTIIEEEDGAPHPTGTQEDRELQRGPDSQGSRTQNAQRVDSGHSDMNSGYHDSVNSYYHDNARSDSHGTVNRGEHSREIRSEGDLERFEGNLSDKFTDMNRNYRNYYDFDKKSSSFQEDSKVLYFQQKVLKQNYSCDNYYNPHQKGMVPDASQRGQAGDLHVPELNLCEEGQFSQGPSSVRSEYNVKYSVRDTVSTENNSVNHMGQYRRTFSEHTYAPNTNVGSSSMYLGREPERVMSQKSLHTLGDSINQNGRRTMFASTADIYNMFQSASHANQLNRPASYRHSFHVMPNTPINLVLDPTATNQALDDNPRPRSSSASVTSSQGRTSWNPFGSMFKKKAKNGDKKAEKTPVDQDKLSSSKKEKDNVSKCNGVMPNPNGGAVSSSKPSKPIPQPPKQYMLVPIIRQPKAQMMRNACTETSQLDFNHRKSQTLPLQRGGNSIYDRYQTIETEEGDTKKLSTLV